MDIEEVHVESTGQQGQVRVAKYRPGTSMSNTTGYRNVLIHTSAHGLGGPLSPYVLRNEQGHLLENIWQFSKLYPRVDAQRIPLTRNAPSVIIWDHPAEQHMDPSTREPTDAYWEWRQKGMNNAHAVRYPNGFHGRHECVTCLWPDEKGVMQRLGYIEARKQVYCGEYARLAPQTAAFQEMQALLRRGVNLQIWEVDGPDTSLVTKSNPGLLITEKTIHELINDTRKPFGHGYTIAALLLGIPLN